MTTKDTNRKTGIPVKTLPAVVSWLIENCTKEELFYMAGLASKSREFSILNSIFTRLTDYNIHQVFYENFNQPEELHTFRAAKRGEVASLKGFAMACQAAREEIELRKKRK